MRPTENLRIKICQYEKLAISLHPNLREVLIKTEL